MASKFVVSVVVAADGSQVKVLGADAERAGAGVKHLGESAHTAGTQITVLEQKAAGLKEALEGLAGLIAFERIKDAIHEGVAEAVSARESFAQLEAGVRSTGGAAGYSATQLRELAEQQQRLTGIHHEVVEGAEAVLLTFTRIGREAFPLATAAALDLSVRMKEDARTAALQLGKALNEPIAGATALRRIGVQLSDSQVELIKKFAAVHDIVGADNVILAEMQKEFGGSAAAAHAAKGGLDDLQNTVKELFREFGEGLLPAVSQLSAELTLLAHDPKFVEAVSNAGHSLGEVLLAVGHAAEFLAQHWEAVKDLVVLFIAFKIPVYVMEIVKAVRALAIASGAAAATNPVGWIAAAAAAVLLFKNHLDELAESEAKRAEDLRQAHESVGKLTTAYGHLASAEVDAAEAGLATLETQKAVLQNQISALLNKVATSIEDQSIINARRAQAGLEPLPAARADTSKLSKGDQDALAELKNSYKDLDSELEEATKRIEGHRKALQGAGHDTSDWGLKAKKTADFLAEAGRVVRSYGDHIADTTAKVELSISGQQSLWQSLDLGVGAYERQKLANERSSAVETASIQLAKEHRSEIERLTDILKKANDEKQSGQAAAIQAMIEHENAAYEAQVSTLTTLVGKEVDLKQAVAARLAIAREDIAFSEELRTAQAELTVAMTGSSKASRDLSTTLAIERAQLAQNAIAGSPFAAAIALRIKLRHDEIDALKDQTAGEQKYQELLQRERQAVQDAQVAAIHDPHIRAMEEGYVAFLRSLGGKTEEETSRLFEALAKREGISIEALTERILESAGKIDDARRVAAAAGAGAGGSELSSFRAEVAEWERLVQEAGLSVEDAQAKIAEATRAHYDSIVSHVSGALDALAQQFGGFFAQLQSYWNRLQSIIQGAQQVSSGVGGLASNLGANAGTASSIGGAAGGAFAMVAVLRAIYEFDKAAEEAARLRQYSLGAVATGRQSPYGGWGIGGQLDAHGQLTQQSRDASNAINDAMLAVADAIGGTLKQFEYIEIKVRNDGKYFQAIVGQTLIGTFDSMQAATQAALRAALLSANTLFTGVGDIVKQGLAELASGQIGQNLDFEQIKDFLEKLKEIEDLGKSEGAIQLASTLKNLDDLWRTLAQLKDVTPQVVQGFANLQAAEVNAWEAWRRGITGVQETRAEQLADKQREAQLFNDEKKLRIAELQVRLADLQAQAQAEQAHAHLVRANTEIDRGSLESYAAFLQAKGKLLEVDGGLTGTYISLITQEIAAIERIIADLQNIPDINPDDIHLPRSGRGGADREQAARDWQQSLQAILDTGRPLIAQYHQLTQAQQDLKDKAKAAHVSAAELAAGLAALDAQFKKDVRSQAEQLAGIGTDFTAKLREGLDFFKQLAELGRQKTGIPDWLAKVLEGKFLDSMAKQLGAAINQLAGIADPFAGIDAQADQLRQNLVALAAATHMTGEQVLAASVAIDHAAAMAKQAAQYSLEDKLFEPLKDLPAWQGRIVELKEKELELQYEILRAQLVAAGLWEKDKDVWQASHDASVAALHVAQTQLSAADREAAIQADRNMVAGYDLVKAQQDAAAKFRDLVRGLVDANRQILTGSGSSLSPREKYETALADYQRTLALAQGGNSQALGDIVGIRSTLLQVAQQYFAGGAGEGLGAGYDQLLRQTLADFSNLALNPNVEAHTMTDLLARQNTTAEAVGAQTHADLVALRQDMISLLAGYRVGNVIGGAAAFAPPPVLGAIPVGAAFTVGGPSPQTDAKLDAILIELQAVRRERRADAQAQLADLDRMADNASDELSARKRGLAS